MTSGLPQNPPWDGFIGRMEALIIAGDPAEVRRAALDYWHMLEDHPILRECLFELVLIYLRIALEDRARERGMREE